MIHIFYSAKRSWSMLFLWDNKAILWIWADLVFRVIWIFFWGFMCGCRVKNHRGFCSGELCSSLGCWGRIRGIVFVCGLFGVRFRTVCGRSVRNRGFGLWEIFFSACFSASQNLSIFFWPRLPKGWLWVSRGRSWGRRDWGWPPHGLWQPHQITHQVWVYLQRSCT